MLCARPRLAPHAPAPPCAAPQGPDEYRTRALRSASLVPVAEEQPAEEGTTRKEVRGRAWAVQPAALSAPRARVLLTLHAPSPRRAGRRRGVGAGAGGPADRRHLARRHGACRLHPPTRRLPCTGHVATTPASPPVCAVGREQAGVDEVPADADQARGEPPARPRPPDLGRPARGVHRLQPYTQAATLCMQAATLREPRLRSRTLYNVETAACRLQPYAPTLQPYAPQLPNFHSLCRTDYSSGRSASPSGPSGSSPTAGTRPSATSCWYAPLYA